MTKQGRTRRSFERGSRDEYRLLNLRLRQSIDRDDRKESGFLWEGWEPREWRPSLIHKGGKP